MRTGLMSGVLLILLVCAISIFTALLMTRANEKGLFFFF